MATTAGQAPGSVPKPPELAAKQAPATKKTEVLDVRVVYTDSSGVKRTLNKASVQPDGSISSVTGVTQALSDNWQAKAGSTGWAVTEVLAKNLPQLMNVAPAQYAREIGTIKGKETTSHVYMADLGTLTAENESKLLTVVGGHLTDSILISEPVTAGSVSSLRVAPNQVSKKLKLDDSAERTALFAKYETARKVQSEALQSHLADEAKKDMQAEGAVKAFEQNEQGELKATTDATTPAHSQGAQTLAQMHRYALARAKIADGLIAERTGKKTTKNEERVKEIDAFASDSRLLEGSGHSPRYTRAVIDRHYREMRANGSKPLWDLYSAKNYDDFALSPDKILLNKGYRGLTPHRKYTSAQAKDFFLLENPASTDPQKDGEEFRKNLNKAQERIRAKEPKAMKAARKYLSTERVAESNKDLSIASAKADKVLGKFGYTSAGMTAADYREAQKTADVERWYQQIQQRESGRSVNLHFLKGNFEDDRFNVSDSDECCRFSTSKERIMDLLADKWEAHVGAAPTDLTLARFQKLETLHNEVTAGDPVKINTAIEQFTTQTGWTAEQKDAFNEALQRGAEANFNANNDATGQYSLGQRSTAREKTLFKAQHQTERLLKHYGFTPDKAAFLQKYDARAQAQAEALYGRLKALDEAAQEFKTSPSSEAVSTLNDAKETFIAEQYPVGAAPLNDERKTQLRENLNASADFAWDLKQDKEAYKQSNIQTQIDTFEATREARLKTVLPTGNVVEDSLARLSVESKFDAEKAELQQELVAAHQSMKDLYQTQRNMLPDAIHANSTRAEREEAARKEQNFQVYADAHRQMATAKKRQVGLQRDANGVIHKNGKPVKYHNNSNLTTIELFNEFAKTFQGTALGEFFEVLSLIANWIATGGNVKTGPDATLGDQVAYRIYTSSGFCERSAMLLKDSIIEQENGDKVLDLRHMEIKPNDPLSAKEVITAAAIAKVHLGMTDDQIKLPPGVDGKEVTVVENYLRTWKRAAEKSKALEAVPGDATRKTKAMRDDNDDVARITPGDDDDQSARIVRGP